MQIISAYVFMLNILSLIDSGTCETLYKLKDTYSCHRGTKASNKIIQLKLKLKLYAKSMNTAVFKVYL